MRIGVNTYIWSAEFTPAHLPLLPRIRSHGFDGVEIPIFKPATFPAALVRDALREHGLACTAVSAFGPSLSLIADEPETRRRTIAHLEDTIGAAAEMGASILAGPLYSPVGYLAGRRRTPDEWARAVEAFRALVPALERSGVTLALEPLNRFETYFLNTAADAVAFCQEVGHDRVGILFDTFHANIEEKDLGAAIRLARDHLRHVHISENDRGTPGSGHVAWPEVLAALQEADYDGWLTIESFGFALGELSAAASIWRDIEPTPESIAWDGIAFLRGLLGGKGRHA